MHTSKVETVKLQAAVLPDVSVTVQVTVVIPSGKADPDGGLHTMLATPQLSPAVPVATDGVA